MKNIKIIAGVNLFKKILYTISIALIIFLTIAAISAEDNDTATLKLEESAQTSNADPHSFAGLQDTINDADAKSTLYLSGTYKYNKKSISKNAHNRNVLYHTFLLFSHVLISKHIFLVTVTVVCTIPLCYTKAKRLKQGNYHEHKTQIHPQCYLEGGRGTLRNCRTGCRHQRGSR